MIKRILQAVVMVMAATGSVLRAQAPVVIHAGHFPNITHSQGVIGQANGWFDKAVAPKAKIDWKVFNAGPDEIEAVFAGALDIAYVGPNPAISGYVRSHGQALRIVAGATSGGAALIVRQDSGIQKPEDFHGKRIATPQLGNTQDVALRSWLQAHGMKSREQGGDVQVVPTANADQLTLFTKKEIDAAWAPEPWASRLIREAQGRLFLDERALWPDGQFATTELIVNMRFLQQHRDLVERWVAAHVELTDWINHNLPEAKRVLNQEIARETGKPLQQAILDDSFGRLQVTYDPLRAALTTSANQAFALGFLGREQPNLSALCDVSILNAVLRKKGAPPVH